MESPHEPPPTRWSTKLFWIVLLVSVAAMLTRMSTQTLTHEMVADAPLRWVEVEVEVVGFDPNGHGDGSVPVFIGGELVRGQVSVTIGPEHVDRVGVGTILWGYADPDGIESQSDVRLVGQQVVTPPFDVISSVGMTGFVLIWPVAGVSVLVRRAWRRLRRRAPLRPDVEPRRVTRVDLITLVLAPVLLGGFVFLVRMGEGEARKDSATQQVEATVVDARARRMHEHAISWTVTVVYDHPSAGPVEATFKEINGYTRYALVGQPIDIRYDPDAPQIIDAADAPTSDAATTLAAQTGAVVAAIVFVPSGLALLNMGWRRRRYEARLAAEPSNRAEG